MKQSSGNTETSQRSNLPIPEDFSKALHTFDIGQNDLAVGFRKMNDEQLRAEIPDIVNKFSAAVQVSPSPSNSSWGKNQKTFS